MNGAVVGGGGGQWLERGTKIAVFDLPDAEVEIDLSDVERTRKRQAVPAQGTEEVRADDILAEFPVDPNQPYQMRVPDALLARAALLTAQLPRDKDRDRDTVPPPPRAGLRRAAWIFAAVTGASIGIVLAAAIAFYQSAPIPSAPAHTFKAGTSAKIFAQHASMLGSGVMVPTVSVDSLPRARR